MIFRKACSVAICFLVIVVSILLSACNHTVVDNPSSASSTVNDGNVDSKEEVTLRILTEPSSSKTEILDNLLSRHILDYRKEHPNVSVVVERLPNSAEEQEIALERARTELVAGRGPDILLLHTDAEVIIDGKTNAADELIPDVNLAMRNGIFADISALYDADTKLDKNALNTTIMDAGVVGEARYVLPLRYNIPVAFVNVDRLESVGLSTEMFSSGVVGMMDTIAKRADTQTAAGATFSGIIRQTAANFLPEFVDYDAQEVLITEQDLIAYLSSFQKFNGTRKGEFGPDELYLQNYYESKETGWDCRTWVSDGYCMDVDYLDMAIQHAALAKASGIDLEMIPIKATDGTLVADITYYCAVTNGCENVDAAYDFLRYFLQEEYQWEINTSLDIGSGHLATSGWPVRMRGSVPTLAKWIRKQLGDGKNPLRDELRLEEMTDDDIPILQVPIDRVQFSVSLETSLADQMWKLNGSTGEPTGANIEDIAAEFIENVEWHLYEG